MQTQMHYLSMYWEKSGTTFCADIKINFISYAPVGYCMFSKSMQPKVYYIYVSLFRFNAWAVCFVHREHHMAFDIMHSLKASSHNVTHPCTLKYKLPYFDIEEMGKKHIQVGKIFPKSLCVNPSIHI